MSVMSIFGTHVVVGRFFAKVNQCGNPESTEFVWCWTGSLDTARDCRMFVSDDAAAWVRP